MSFTSTSSVGIMLATCSQELRLWNWIGENGNITNTQIDIPTLDIRPHKGAVQAVHWNHNNSHFLTAGEDGYLATIDSSGRILFTIPPKLSSASGIVEPSLFSFALTSGSRYVLIAGERGKLEFWDLKKHTLHRALKGHQEDVTSVDLSPLLSSASTSATPSLATAPLFSASGCMSGDILIHNLSTGHITSTLKQTEHDGVTTVQYSPHRLSVLGSAGEAGIPTLWDLNLSTPMHNFSTSHHHSAPITSLLFSPTTPSLLLTTSLANTLYFHSPGTPQPIHTFTYNTPITSADWSDDSTYVALGFMDGNIKILDTRKMAEPNNKELLHIRAHSREVRGVRFQKRRVRSSSTSSSRSGSKSSPNKGEVFSSRDPMATPARGKAALDTTITPAPLRSSIAPTTGNNISNAVVTSDDDIITPYIPTKRLQFAGKDGDGIKSLAATALQAYANQAKNTQTPNVTKSDKPQSAQSLSPTSFNSLGNDLSPPPTSNPASSSINYPLSNTLNTNPRPPKSAKGSSLNNQPSTNQEEEKEKEERPREWGSSRRTRFNENEIQHSEKKEERKYTDHNQYKPYAHSSFLPTSQPPSSPPPPPPPPPPPSSTLSLPDVSSLLERHLSLVSTQLREDIQNVHVDMLREFHRLTFELTNQLQLVKRENNEMREEIRELKAQLNQSLF